MLYIPEMPASKFILVDVKATPSFLKLFGMDLYSDSAIDIAEAADSGLIFFNLDEAFIIFCCVCCSKF
jgi:hypothetical protein